VQHRNNLNPLSFLLEPFGFFYVPNRAKTNVPKRKICKMAARSGEAFLSLKLSLCLPYQSFVEGFFKNSERDNHLNDLAKFDSPAELNRSDWLCHPLELCHFCIDLASVFYAVLRKLR
jgi:hypothetical protein